MTYAPLGFLNFVGWRNYRDQCVVVNCLYNE